VANPKSYRCRNCAKPLADRTGAIAHLSDVDKDGFNHSVEVSLGDGQYQNLGDLPDVRAAIAAAKEG
jgi:hypothetical protein